MTITIAAIAAMSQNLVIGKDNKMPWHIPEDFKHFKKTTMGKPLIMGRKTFESVGGKPLPGRPHVIISRSAQAPVDGVTFVSSIEEAIEATKAIAKNLGVDEVFIAGGAQIYEAALPFTDRIYLTVINQDYEGDTFFPKLNPAEWSEEIIATATEPVPYMIGVLNRK